MELTKVSCPCCEGSVQIKLNQKEAKCNYCDTVFLVSDVINNNDTKDDASKKDELLKDASKYANYYDNLSYEIYRLYTDLKLTLFETSSEYDTSMTCIKINNMYKFNFDGFASSTVFPKMYYKDVEVSKDKLDKNHYKEEYEKWLNDNKDLYTKLLEIEKKLRELEKKPISLKKDNNKEITSSKEDVKFLKETNSNDFNEQVIDELEKNLRIRIDDLKFSKIELLLFSKKDAETKDIRKEFNDLRISYAKGKELKRRSEGYDSLSPSEIDFLNNWLELRNLVISFGLNISVYLKLINLCKDKENFNLDEDTKQKLKEYEEKMDEIRFKLEDTDLLNVVRSDLKEFYSEKNKKIS